MIPELLSCADPPSIELFDKSVSPSEYQLLSVTDPVVLKRELLYGYYHLGDLLVTLSATGRITGCLVNRLAPEEIGAVRSFADLFQRTIHRARFLCYLYLRLPEDTLDQVPMQEQRCALDILWFQLDNLLWTFLTYCHSGIPTYWFSGFRTFVRPLHDQISNWYDQLKLDLAHLDPPDPTASVDQQEPSIATRTRSHDPQHP
jgi:hypothetical protein